MVEYATLFRRPTFLLKILEMVIAACCTALMSGEMTVSWSVNKVAVVYATLIGYMMVGIIVILAYILDTPLHRFLRILVSVSGCLMFASTGVLICELYGGTVKEGTARTSILACLLASGILAIVNAAVYGADVFFTMKETV